MHELAKGEELRGARNAGCSLSRCDGADGTTSWRNPTVRKSLKCDCSGHVRPPLRLVQCKSIDSSHPHGPHALHAWTCPQISDHAIQGTWCSAHFPLCGGRMGPGRSTRAAETPVVYSVGLRLAVIRLCYLIDNRPGQISSRALLHGLFHFHGCAEDFGYRVKADSLRTLCALTGSPGPSAENKSKKKCTPLFWLQRSRENAWRNHGICPANTPTRHGRLLGCALGLITCSCTLSGGSDSRILGPCVRTCIAVPHSHSQRTTASASTSHFDRSQPRTSYVNARLHWLSHHQQSACAGSLDA